MVGTIGHRLPPTPPKFARSPQPHILTYGCLIPDQAISQIENMAADAGGTGTDHFPRDAAQLFADVVDQVRLHSPSVPRHAV